VIQGRRARFARTCPWLPFDALLALNFDALFALNFDVLLALNFDVLFKLKFRRAVKP
jgi:hypothetical protein